MKIYTGVEQGSEAWLALRIGIPTASMFGKIVTTKKAELSAQAHSYALRLVAERLLNTPATLFGGDYSGPWMERGKDMEPLAVAQYQFQFEVETIPVSFITTDDGRIGCSPDRLVVSEKRIGLEIKSPSPQVHLGYLLDGVDDDYKPQIQGQLLVGEFERVDLYSYNPSMPPALIQTVPDEPYVAKLRAALLRFVDILDDMTERAKAIGAFQPAARVGSEAREVKSINDEMRRENEKRFVKEGFTL